MDRVDDTLTGKVADVFQSPIPEWKIKEANEVAATQGDKLFEKFPLLDGVKWMNQENLAEMYLDNVWRPNLSITGAGDIPALTKAGNVVRAKTTVRVSLRVSPDFDAEKAKQTLINLFTTNVPYNAKVSILTAHAGNGFCMKVL